MRYADFSRDIHDRALARRVPVNGAIEVTRRCPLACTYCYNRVESGDAAEAAAAELSAAEHRRILDEITEAGCLWLLYTGGEIFARDDFLDIYGAAHERGLLITLFTNGTLLTPRIADALAELRPFSIEITLCGASAATYERVTGVPGSYARCRRGIDLLVERRLPLTLKTVLTTVNRHELEAMRRFAEDDVGVPYRHDAMINPRLDGSTAPLSVRLDPAKVAALDLADSRRASAWRAAAAAAAGTRQQDGETLYRCGGGLHSFAIDPYGRLSLCALSAVETYDLRSGTFRDGWERFLREVRERPRSRPNSCAACEARPFCELCPASGQLESGDPERPVPFFCAVALERARAFAGSEHA